LRNGVVGEALTGKRKAEAEQLNWQFVDLIKAVHRLAPEARLQRDIFHTALAQSSEAAAHQNAIGCQGQLLRLLNWNWLLGARLCHTGNTRPKSGYSGVTRTSEVVI
jgi:hypothetical protein